MYQYRIIQRAADAVRRGFIIVGLLLGAALALELVRAYAILQRIHPFAGWAYLAVLAVCAVYGLWRLLGFLQDHDTLHPADLPPPDQARHKDLVAHCRSLARRLRRMSRSVYLEEEQQRFARQTAYDIQEMLDHHPLLEDLTRAIVHTEQKVIADLHAHLDAHAQAMTRDKMAAIVADVIQPPFPVVNAAVVFYHEVTLCAAITGVYVSEPALTEYWTVLRDTWRVMTRGDFIRIGQSLFAGVYANCPPMGTAVEDLGHATACIWLTESVAEATALRCKTIRRWDVPTAIAAMDARCHVALTATRDILIKDVLPIMKTAFHHKVPRTEGESPTFMSNLITGITKSFDIVVNTLKTTPIPEAVQNSRRTEHGASLDLESGYVVVRHKGRRRRSGHGSGVGGLTRIFRTISQRLKYTTRYPRL